ncbi:MAG: ABC transporter permease, partial [Planctomycetota bacterium]
MKLGRLVIRSLAFYWRTGSVVAFGVAVATAVIVGSLIVGDSVTGSIRDTALSRLGGIDHALVAPRFFRSALAADLADRPGMKGKVRRIVPAVIVQGAAANPRSGAALPKAHVIAAGRGFWSFFGGGEKPALSGRNAVVNEALARDLGVGKGDAVILRVARPSAAPADTLFGRRNRKGAVGSMRLTVAAVLPASAGGNFGLDAGTRTPRNIFVSREWLSAQLDLGGRANALLVESLPDRREETAGLLQSALAEAATLEDYGLALSINAGQGYVSLQSRSLLFDDAQLAAAASAAKECNAGLARTSVYLANTIQKVGGDRKSIAYAVIAGAEQLKPMPAQEGKVDDIASHDIVLNAWAAEDLGAKPGDRVTLSYYEPSRAEVHRTRTVELTVRGIVKLAGSAADPALVPDFEGITDARTMSDWDPPFPIDLARITDRDEAYWEKHRATPKAFVSLRLMPGMWLTDTPAAVVNWITSLRLAPHGTATFEELRDQFATALRRRLRPASAALTFRPVREQSLAAAKGSTDFGVLFISMSMFLVIAAIGLAGTLTRLSTERRASEMGTMMASGFSAAAASRVVVAEGIVLAGLGALVGAPLGVLYASGIIQALRTWWYEAVAGSALWLHVVPVSIAVGWAAGCAAGVVSVWWGARLLRRSSALDLLSGWRAAGTRSKRTSPLIAIVLLIVSVFLVIFLLLQAAADVISPTAAFFGIGAALLLGGLCTCYLLLLGALARRKGRISIGRLALRSAATNRRRSMLAVGLLACASFVLVAVAANERHYTTLDPRDPTSGAGGFSLKAESSLPVHYDFGTEAGRKRLGFDPNDESIFKGVRVVSFMLASGDDISCLNLAKPVQPRVIGVLGGVAHRFRAMGIRYRPRGWDGIPARSRREPTAWELLRSCREADTIPVIGDAESVRWQLQSGLGETITVDDETGKARRLRFVGLVPSGIFGGELLVSGEHFAELFPSERAPRYFLIETPPEKEAAVAGALRRNLGDLGLEVRGTREILNDLIGVQNTYLSTFLALGGLGVLLGTVGLVVVLLRNALERRGELALMLATGFTRRYLAALLIVENAGLLAAGLACGTVSALVAVGPQLSSAT